MARTASAILSVFLIGCGRPAHQPAPVPVATRVTAPEARPAASAIKVAIMTPNGAGNWAGALELSPAPASLVASCIEPGAAGWISVNVETRAAFAAVTSLAEGSPDTSAAMRECVVKALTSLHAPTDRSTLLVYVTFSPE
jgi:hypothetical protein